MVQGVASAGRAVEERVAVLGLLAVLDQDASIALHQQECCARAQVVQGVVSAGRDEGESVAALGLLCELAECPAALVGPKALPGMATWCFALATNRAAALPLRHAAMQARLSGLWRQPV